MIKDIKFSYFDKVTDTIPSKTIGLYDFLDTRKIIPEIDIIRSETNKSKRSDLKKKMPAVTLSGVFSQRGAKYLIKHSGLICLDIDRDQNPNISNFTDLKLELSKLPEILYAGASISGIENGLFALLKIAFPEKHKEHFKALQSDFLSKWGIVIDGACSDVSRLRFVSYDLKPYYNFKAAPYLRLPPRKQTNRYQAKQFNSDSWSDPFKIARRSLEKQGLIFSDGHKHNYIFQLASLTNKMGVPKEEVERFVSNELGVQVKSNCITGPYTTYSNEFGVWSDWKD